MSLAVLYLKQKFDSSDEEITSLLKAENAHDSQASSVLLAFPDN